MAQIWIAGPIGIAAVVDDLSRRRISNWIPAVALLAGLGLQITQYGWRGGLSGLLGAMTGGAVFLIFYLLGGMGAGDIKLMAGFGAILGATGILEASLWTAACGGILATGVMLVSTLQVRWRKGRSRISGNAECFQPARRVRADSIPYAPAIAAGVWLSLVSNA